MSQRTSDPSDRSGVPAASASGENLTAPSSRDKILEVAEALFARRGYTGVGMREVAEAVGLGKSSLFHHFRSKAQLYLAVLDRLLGRFETRLRAALRPEGGVVERLDRWVDAVVDGLAEAPSAARLLLRALFEDEDFDAAAWPEGRAVERKLGAMLQALRALLEEGVARRELRRTSTPHTIQTLIGVTIYHFASGQFGEDLLGGSLLSAEAVRARKAEIREILHFGLAERRGGPHSGGPR